jgi:hypothetical protein
MRGSRIKDPIPQDRIRCPKCFAYGAEPWMRQVWDKYAHMYRDVPEYVRADCSTCHGNGWVQAGRAG